MAKIIYEVYQNQNEHNAAYGKWYGRVKYLESLNTRKLSNHIAEHGSIYTPDIVYGVMEKFRSCLLEMLLNSKKVKIEGLGTFYTTLECKKGGAVSKEKFNILKDIQGLHIRFLPEQEQEQNISSRQFLKQAEFINVDSLTKKEEEGESGRRRKRARVAPERTAVLRRAAKVASRVSRVTRIRAALRRAQRPRRGMR